jgi:hypothetical protein
MMEAIRSPATLILARATRRHIPEDGILHDHRREILKYSTVQQIGYKVKRWIKVLFKHDFVEKAMSHQFTRQHIISR